MTHVNILDKGKRQCQSCWKVFNESEMKLVRAGRGGYWRCLACYNKALNYKRKKDGVT